MARKYQYGSIINGYELVRRGWAHDDSYVFRCACGGEFQSTIHSIKKRKLPGCHNCSSNFIFKNDLTGKTFGRLFVLGRAKNLKKEIAFLCRCECGKETIVTSKNLRSGHTKSCGALEHRRGENSPLYKGGRKPREHQEGYLEWRSLVYGRDNYTCQKCGRKGNIDLNAHHIFTHHDFPNLRVDINNGVSLCTDCHTLFHKTYGYTSIPPQAILEYMNLPQVSATNTDTILYAVHGYKYFYNSTSIEVSNQTYHECAETWRHH